MGGNVKPEPLPSTKCVGRHEESGFGLDTIPPLAPIFFGSPILDPEISSALQAEENSETILLAFFKPNLVFSLHLVQAFGPLLFLVIIIIIITVWFTKEATRGQQRGPTTVFGFKVRSPTSIPVGLCFEGWAPRCRTSAGPRAACGISWWRRWRRRTPPPDRHHRCAPASFPN